MRYEKGRKDASRQRIMDVGAERFRSDGIAASGYGVLPCTYTSRPSDSL